MLLTRDWFMENIIDFEYHYYRLNHIRLEIKKKYLALELYPYLKNMIERLNETEQLLSSFLGIENNDNVDDSIEEIIKTLEYGQKVMSELVNEGIDLYNVLKNMLNITFLSVCDPIPYFGHIVFYSPAYENISIYKYECKKIAQHDGNNDTLFYINVEKTEEIENIYKKLFPSFTQIVKKIIHNNYCNVVLCHNDIYIPHSQVLEICKRELANIVYNENLISYSLYIL